MRYGKLFVSREQPQLTRLDNSLRPIRRTQLAKNVARMFLDRTDRDDELVRDRLVRIPGIDEPQDF